MLTRKLYLKYICNAYAKYLDLIHYFDMQLKGLYIFAVMYKNNIDLLLEKKVSNKVNMQKKR